MDELNVCEECGEEFFAETHRDICPDCKDKEDRQSEDPRDWKYYRDQRLEQEWNSEDGV